MFDPLKVFESDFRTVLAAGETPLAAVSFQLAFGSEQLERSPEELAHLFRFLPRGIREQLLAASQEEPVTKSGWERVPERGFDARGTWARWPTGCRPHCGPVPTTAS